MDIQAKLDLIEEKKEAALNKTPDEHKADNIKKLYEDVLEARSTAENAPFRVTTLEKKYYTYRYGEDGYKQHLVDRYLKDGRTVRNNMLTRHNVQTEALDQSLSYYDSVRVYLKNMAEVQKTLLTHIKALLDKIRTSQVETNYRKSYFMEQVQASVNTRIVLCNIFILSSIAVLGFQYRDQLQTKKISGTLVALFIVVFGLSYLIQWITYLPLSLNVYTRFGYDPTESKQQWYFIIPIGMVLLWYLLQYLS